MIVYIDTDAVNNSASSCVSGYEEALREAMEDEINIQFSPLPSLLKIEDKKRNLIL